MRGSLPRAWPAFVRTALLHVAALARVASIRRWSHELGGARTRDRARAVVEQLESEIALLREELRVKDARLARMPPRRRPQYPPLERLAVLKLMAARGWSLAEGARHFFVEAATIASWRRRADERGEQELVRTPRPINRFPEFVREIVTDLAVTHPELGRRRIADHLARAGLHLASSTVRRIMRAPRERGPAPSGPRRSRPSKPVRATRPHHVWQVDLSVLPMSGGGFWVPWVPYALAQTWPFAWWIAVIIDQHSRKIVGFEVFHAPPSGAQVVAVFERSREAEGATPKYVVSDKGTQFTGDDYLRWCEWAGVEARYAATDSHRATAVIERFFRTLKQEHFRTGELLVRADDLRTRIGRFVRWYERHRPHQGLGGRTPHEVLHGLPPANEAPRLEPRARWPAGSPCAKPQVAVRELVEDLELVVEPFEGDDRMPVVSLKPKRAA